MKRNAAIASAVLTFLILLWQLVAQAIEIRKLVTETTSLRTDVAAMTETLRVVVDREDSLREFVANDLEQRSPRWANWKFDRRTLTWRPLVFDETK